MRLDRGRDAPRGRAPRGALRLRTVRERIVWELRRLRHAVRRFRRDLERPERGLRRSLSLSLGLHLALLLAFTIFPGWVRSARWESPPLIVSLVTLPVSEPPARTTPRTTPRAAPRARPAVPKREEPRKPKLAEPRREKQSLPASPAPEPVAQEAPPETTAAPAPAVPVQVTARVEEAQFVYDYYLQTVIGKISEAWQPPAGLGGRSAETEATLCFRITATGRVERVAVETSSTVALFDRSAQEAIQRAQPFPPFPPGYAGRWLTIHLRFGYGRGAP